MKLNTTRNLTTKKPSTFKNEIWPAFSDAI